jgi:hypothetical protein
MCATVAMLSKYLARQTFAQQAQWRAFHTRSLVLVLDY